MKRLAVWLVLYYIRFWAQVALFIHRPTIIGIAGSAGKSSCKEILYAILKNVAPTKFTYGNSETGVPLGILGLDAGGSNASSWLKNIVMSPLKILNQRGITYLIIEMGTDEPSAPKNMEYLLSIVKPDIAVWLNAYPIHSQQFASVLDSLDPKRVDTMSEAEKLNYIVQAIAHEDGKIITQSDCQVGIYSKDNPPLNQEITQYLEQNPLATLASFGTDESNTLSYTDYEVSVEGTDLGFRLNGQPIDVKLAGYVLPQEYRETIGAAILTASHLGIAPETIVANLTKNFHLPKGRASLLPGINGSVILDSTYNAATAPMVTMLDLLQRLKTQTNRPTILIWGDMRELGPAAPTEHQKVATHLDGIVDHLILVGPLTQQYVLPFLQTEGAQFQTLQWFKTSPEAGTYLKDHLPANAIILTKGSQNTIFIEEAVKMLLANPEDAAKLCRQEDFWMNRKQASFSRHLQDAAESSA